MLWGEIEAQIRNAIDCEEKMNAKSIVSMFWMEAPVILVIEVWDAFPIDLYRPHQGGCAWLLAGRSMMHNRGHCDPSINCDYSSNNFISSNLGMKRHKLQLII